MTTGPSFDPEIGTNSDLHPKVTYGRHTYGTINCSFDVTATVGNFTQIGFGCLALGDRSNHPGIEKDSKLVTTYPLDKRFAIEHYPSQARSRGPIMIGHDVWLGMQVKLLPGAMIGNGAVVGAFSVVAGIVPPYAIVVGNPARIVRFRFNDEIVQQLLAIKWWNWLDEFIQDHIDDFTDVESFVRKYGT